MLFGRLFYWNLSHIILLFMLVITGSATWAAYDVLQHKRHLVRAVRHVKTNPPPGLPPVTQHSIDVAIAIYGIEIPPNADYPKLDLHLADRGLTSLEGYGNRLQIKIGPGAFSSWGLLGSTLAHELEVHCNQDFLLIKIMDLLGLDGTGLAEREAYQYEIDQTDRFGHALKDLDGIRYTLDYYYPHAPSVKSRFSGLTYRMQRWMVAAKN